MAAASGFIVAAMAFDPAIGDLSWFLHGLF